ncbi:MAG: Arm DNA-binding domain-containing protein [Raineya sp.]|nr:Arm DNA-binding domain-containing protein [Raineya sp.]
MKATKINILFWLRKNYINRKGTCQIYCGISARGKKAEFSTGLYIRPNDFDQKRQQAKKTADQSEFINIKLAEIRNFLIKEKIRLELLHKPITPQILKERIFIEYTKIQEGEK